MRIKSKRYIVDIREFPKLQFLKRSKLAIKLLSLRIRMNKKTSGLNSLWILNLARNGKGLFTMKKKSERKICDLSRV